MGLPIFESFLDMVDADNDFTIADLFLAVEFHRTMTEDVFGGNPIKDEEQAQFFNLAIARYERDSGQTF